MSLIEYLIVHPKSIVKEYEEPDTLFYIIKIGIPTKEIEQSFKGMIIAEASTLKEDYLIQKELDEIEERKTELIKKQLQLGKNVKKN